MSETFGQFVEPGQTAEYVIMSFSMSTLPLQDRWRNNSLSADFLADYWQIFLFAPDQGGHRHAAGLKDIVSYIANELLENAVKFHHHAPEFPIRVSIYQIERCLRFYITNSVTAKAASAFQQYIRTLLTEEPGELFLRQIEQNACEEDNESHLGLLTLVNDYQVRLGWKFEPVDRVSDAVLVTTMAELPLEP